MLALINIGLMSFYLQETKRLKIGKTQCIDKSAVLSDKHNRTDDAGVISEDTAASPNSRQGSARLRRRWSHCGRRGGRSRRVPSPGCSTAGRGGGVSHVFRSSGSC